MTEINFQPVFDYLENEFKPELKKELRAEIREEFSGPITSIANLAGEIKSLREDMKISNHRVTRLEEWAIPVGKKVDIPLSL